MLDLKYNSKSPFNIFYLACFLFLLTTYILSPNEKVIMHT